MLIAYALSVRGREDIASEAIYGFLPSWAVTTLVYAWQIMTFSFGVFLAWFGLVAAPNVPWQYWELGGLPKRIPMMVLPIAGLLVAMMSGITISEDAFGWRSEADPKAPGSADFH